MKLDTNTRYEIKAEAFRIMAGHMAPGKDAGMHSYPAPYEERLAAWDAWLLQYGAVLNPMLTAVERMLPDGDDA